MPPRPAIRGSHYPRIARGFVGCGRTDVRSTLRVMPGPRMPRLQPRPTELPTSSEARQALEIAVGVFRCCAANLDPESYDAGFLFQLAERLDPRARPPQLRLAPPPD
jgi:hypothetical protein